MTRTRSFRSQIRKDSSSGELCPKFKLMMLFSNERELRLGRRATAALMS